MEKRARWCRGEIGFRRYSVRKLASILRVDGYVLQRKMENSCPYILDSSRSEVLKVCRRLSTGSASLLFIIYYYYFTGFYNPLAGFSLLVLEVPRSHARTHYSR